MPTNKDFNALYTAFASLKTPAEVQMFLADLCTPKEIDDMADRWKAVKMLEQGISYRQIYDQSGVSTATITRVARCLSQGTGGYKMLLERLDFSESPAPKKSRTAKTKEKT